MLSRCLLLILIKKCKFNTTKYLGDMISCYPIVLPCIIYVICTRDNGHYNHRGRTNLNSLGVSLQYLLKSVKMVNINVVIYSDKESSVAFET